jgi:hypothetical protein
MAFGELSNIEQQFRTWLKQDGFITAPSSAIFGD